MKCKILRLYLKLKKNYIYFFNTEIHIGFNIANLFCEINLFNRLFNFLFRIVWIKKYLDHRGYRRKKLNDEARIICNLTIRNLNYYTTFVRYYFSKLIFRKEIFNIGRYHLICSFAKDLKTSIDISFWKPEFSKNIYAHIAISLLGFRIVLGR